MTGFIKAKPIWLAGREKEINLSAGFKCKFNVREGSNYRLDITGSTLYRIFLNGRFIHYGPARGPHGYVRMDELILDEHLQEGVNILSVEAAGYNANSYYTLNIPSFLQAEILEDGKIIGYTGKEGAFSVTELTTRLQKVMRYSFQRTFTEIYNLDNNDALTNWMAETVDSEEDLGEVYINTKYLPRDLPIPGYDIRNAVSFVETGIGRKKEHREGFAYLEHRFINKISGVITGYTLNEISERPFEVLQDTCLITQKSINGSVENGIIDETIDEGEYILLDMGLNNNGFIISDISAHEDSDVYFIFDEKLINGRMDIRSWTWINIVKYTLKKSGKPYALESFESYGYRYIMCYVRKGSINLNYLGLREYSYPEYNNVSFNCNDEKICKVYKAAVETYRQNTLDVFMDCPTRERAGWLCDSYFTAQSALYFSGNTAIEKVFLENYVLAGEFPHIPKGMLPMCYPAEHADGNFIPQWAMWYVIQLEGYFKRNPGAQKETFKDLCYGLVDYFKQFKNEGGLLEKLEKWNFIEWSRANEWVQDVNYPTNMLYSKMLKLIGTWYEDNLLVKESEQVKKTIIKQSFDGELFVDNAVRMEDGNLRLTVNKSEVCQYYAFFFGIADDTESRFRGLKDLILNIFGPDRKEKGIMPEITYANAFIGNYLRMELLLRWKKYSQALAEVKKYFYKMAAQTGTLWEHDSVRGSLNHGFASFAGVVILRSLTGIEEINEREKHVKVDISDVEAIDFDIRIGVGLGEIRFHCCYKDGKREENFTIPEGYQINK